MAKKKDVPELFDNFIERLTQPSVPPKVKSALEAYNLDIGKGTPELIQDQQFLRKAIEKNLKGEFIKDKKGYLAKRLQAIRHKAYMDVGNRIRTRGSLVTTYIQQELNRRRFPRNFNLQSAKRFVKAIQKGLEKDTGVKVSEDAALGLFRESLRDQANLGSTLSLPRSTGGVSYYDTETLSAYQKQLDNVLRRYYKVSEPYDGYIKADKEAKKVESKLRSILLKRKAKEASSQIKEEVNKYTKGIKDKEKIKEYKALGKKAAETEFRELDRIRNKRDITEPYKLPNPLVKAKRANSNSGPRLLGEGVSEAGEEQQSFANIMRKQKPMFSMHEDDIFPGEFEDAATGAKTVRSKVVDSMGEEGSFISRGKNLLTQGKNTLTEELGNSSKLMSILKKPMVAESLANIVPMLATSYIGGKVNDYINQGRQIELGNMQANSMINSYDPETEAGMLFLNAMNQQDQANGLASRGFSPEIMQGVFGGSGDMQQVADGEEQI